MRNVEKARRAKRLAVAAVLIMLTTAGWSLWHHASRIGISFVRGGLAKLTSAQVEVNDVVFKFNGAVQVKGITIRPNVENPGYDDTVFRAGEVDAKLGLWELVFQKIKLRKVIVKDFMIDVQYDIERHRWNAGLLKFVAGAGASPHVPDIILEDGSLRYTKVAGGRRKEMLNVPVNSRLECVEQNTQFLKFRVLTSDKGDEKGSDLLGVWQTGKAGNIDLRGRISWANFSVFDNYWSMDDVHVSVDYDVNTLNISKFSAKLGEKTSIELAGRVKNYRTVPQFEIKSQIKNLYHTSASTPNALVYSDALLDTIGNKVCRKFFRNYKPVGWVDVDIEASGSFSDIKATRCDGVLMCRDVSVEYAEFPYALEKLTGTIDFTNSRVQLNSLSGKHKDVDITVAGFARDLGPTWDADIHITSPNMALDGDLYQALNTTQKKAWFSVSPKGTIGVDFQFKRSPQGVKTHSTLVELKGTCAVFQYLPYPLTNLSGEMLITEANEVQLKGVRSVDGQKEILLNGYVRDANSYDVLISGKNVPMDGEFAAALSDRQRQLFKKYGLSGMLDIEAAVATGKESKYRAMVQVHDGTLKCGEFFDFEAAKFQATVTDNWIGLEKLEAQNDGAKFKLNGQLWQDPSGSNSRYDLAIDVNGLNLDEQLFTKFGPKAADVLKYLKVGGKINLQTHVEGDANSITVKDGIAIECLGNEIALAQMPYVFKNVRGRAWIENQKCVLTDMRADIADGESVRVSGQAQLADGKVSAGRFKGSVHNLKIDERLEKLIPAAMRKQYDQYAVNGAISADVNELIIVRKNNEVNDLTFKGEIKLANCQARTAVPVEKLTGSMEIEAAYSGWDHNFKADANLAAQSLTVKGRLFKNALCRLHYNDKEEVLEISDVAADLCGGKVAGDVKLNGKGYGVDAVFENVGVKEFVWPGKAGSSEYVSGLMSGSLRLHTPQNGGGPRSGQVFVDVSDMQVAKVSFLGKMLLMMKLTEPTDFAFDAMTASAYLNGNELLVDRLDLRGKSLTMRGAGKIELQPATVDLAFIAAGPRLQAQPSMLQSLAEGMIPAIVRVTVKGPMADPKIENTPLPVIKDTLEILGKPVQSEAK